MREPPWKSLVQTLEATDFESEYLNRLSDRLRTVQRPKSIEAEIVQEMAQALARSTDKVNAALLRLDVIADEIDNATDPEVRARKVAAFNRQREEAKRLRWELLVHREAVGLFLHDDIEESFPIPPPIK